MKLSGYLIKAGTAIPVKRPVHQGLFWPRSFFWSIGLIFVKIVGEPVKHYPIPAGEDLAQSPRSSQGRVPTKCTATVLNMLKSSSRSNQNPSSRCRLGRPRVSWRFPCLASPMGFSYSLTNRSYVHVCPITNKNTLDNDLIEFESIKRVCTDRSQA